MEKIFNNAENKKYLSDIRKTIYDITDVLIDYVDTDNRPLYHKKLENIRYSKFCKIISSSKKGRLRCKQSDIFGSQQSIKLNKPYVYKCHAGLTEVSNAIVIDGKVICYIYTGEVLIKEPAQKDIEEMIESNKDLGIDLDKLRTAYKEAKIISKEKLNSIIQLFHLIADSIIKNEKLIQTQKKLENELIKESELKLTLKEMQIKDVLSKLNPHFIFNTLNTISWLAKFKKNEDVIETVESLSDILRYNFYKPDEEYIVLDEDIKFIKLFLKIQKTRFGKDFNYVLDIDRDTLKLKIPKLVLSPIIENAFKHGFKELPAAKLIIRSYIESADLIIEVADNGIGIPEDTLKNIFNKTQSELPSIGLKNVQKLITLKYGKKYGLSISSNIKKGTTVKIKLPVIEKL